MTHKTSIFTALTMILDSLDGKCHVVYLIILPAELRSIAEFLVTSSYETMSTHMFSSSVFEHLKQSYYWFLRHARPFRIFIQLSHVSLHIAVPLAKIPYQVFKMCTVKALYFIANAIRNMSWNFPLPLHQAGLLKILLQNRHHYRQLRMCTVTILNCDVSYTGHRFNKPSSERQIQVFDRNHVQPTQEKPFIWCPIILLFFGFHFKYDYINQI